MYIPIGIANPGWKAQDIDSIIKGREVHDAQTINQSSAAPSPARLGLPLLVPRICSMYLLIAGMVPVNKRYPWGLH